MRTAVGARWAARRPARGSGLRISRLGGKIEDFPRAEQIADGVYTYEQLRSKGPEWEEWFTSVSLFVVTSEGVLVADGQGTPEETARLLATIAQVTDQPVTHVVMGSAFSDHTGGNVVFPETVELFAHPVSDSLHRSQQPGSGEARPLFPTQVVDDRTVLRLGEREIHVLNLGLAHVAGDLSVYLPDEKLLFMSEAYLYRIFPALGPSRRDSDDPLPPAGNRTRGEVARGAFPHTTPPESNPIKTGWSR